MKKIVINIILFVFFLLIFFLVILSTVGIETSKFNKLISDRTKQINNIYLELNKIKFKLEPNSLSLFLETQNPKINYKNLEIPIKNVKIYVDFLPLLKSRLIIKKANIDLEELEITKLNELSTFIKPSNFKSFLNNKIKNGKLICEIEIFLDEKGSIKNYIAKGNIKNLKVETISNLNLTNTSLDFFTDKDDILLKKINGNFEDIEIVDGDIKLNIEDGIKLNSSFDSIIKLNDKFLGKDIKFLDKYKFLKNIKDLKGEFNNNFSINFDNTYKLKNYNYALNGKIQKSKFVLEETFQSKYIVEKINEIYLSDLQVQANLNPKKIEIKGDGKYSIDNKNFLKINLENNFKNDLFNLKLNLDYKYSFLLDVINYKKKKNSASSLFLDLEKKDNEILIKKVKFNEQKNLIEIEDLKFKKKKFFSFKKINVVTENNNFSIIRDKKILIIGTKFDATNLPKFFKSNDSSNNFQNVNTNIEIDFKNILVPTSEKLQNFKLFGEIKNGKFTKISSKGDFGEDNYLDITMKKDINSEKKYLEIYSDLTKPLLSEYSFFKGLSGGKLFFSSVINSANSNSKLKIENFKLINAPGVIKLLSLADLGGLADLAEGEGLSFDTLEINMEKSKNFIKFNEILALGPSISVLMDGYQDLNGMTSLRGTLVPAKTLNKMLSKIPLIGNIIIPKDIGEGLFGISFKMKGPEGKIKTSINPIRTLTPRFIQKIIEKKTK